MRYALILPFFFLLNQIFGQSEANLNYLKTDLDTTRPYYVPSKINGFDQIQVLAAPFAGSTPSQQITWLLTVESGTNFQIKDSFGVVLPQNSLILPGYTLTLFDQNASPFGADFFYPNEGPWSVAQRILTTDSLQYWYQQKKLKAKTLADSLAQERKIDAIIAAQDAELEARQKLEHEKFISLLRNLAMIGGLLFLFSVLYLLYSMYYSPAARERRHQRRLQAVKDAQEEIEGNLEEGVPVYEAGLPQVPGGLDSSNAGNRLSYLAGIPVKNFWPVRITFLRPVEIGYANAYVVFQPNEQDPTIYYLGETEKCGYVVCAMRCGNSILSGNGEPLEIGVDFFVSEVIQTNEVKNYLWANQVAIDNRSN